MYVVALGPMQRGQLWRTQGSQCPRAFPADERCYAIHAFWARSDHKNAASHVARPIDVAFPWKILFFIVTVSAGLYCAFFWYANPVSRTAFASFAPSTEWRFWLFKVTIPAALAGCAFRVLAWAIGIPASASQQAVCGGGLRSGLRDWPVRHRNFSGVEGVCLGKAQME